MDIVFTLILLVLFALMLSPIYTYFVIRIIGAIIVAIKKFKDKTKEGK